MLISREEILFVVLGTIFLFSGTAACCISLVRRADSRRVLAWFGVFSAMYGARLFAGARGAFHLFAGHFDFLAAQIVWTVTYVILVPALCFWSELTVGPLRRFFRAMIIPVAAVAIAGIFAIFFMQSPTRFMGYNNLLVVCLLLALGLANVVPQLAQENLAIQSQVSTIGTLVLASAVVHDNVAPFFGLRNYPFLEPVAFALFVFSQGWVAIEKVLGDERRLVSIENELAIAREIQALTLPSSVPELKGLKVSAAYCPMTAVAGDFYWFMNSGLHGAGFLVADVSGHGVPAALIASMIKVAIQSAAGCADDPQAVLRVLDRTLSGQLRGQFVSAAYLWIDTEKYKARYSAAGHPALLRWDGEQLERIESNGLILGVLPDCECPVRELSIVKGDRFLLYTDGIIEPENTSGEAFGEHRLEQVIRENRSCSPSELSDQLLSAIRKWKPASESQQDDITLLVIDVTLADFA